MNSKKIVVTGAPGSGKTSVLNILAARGFSIVAEPAREIIAEQRAINGEGIYDRNPFLFKELMLSRMIANYKSQDDARSDVIFDRGMPDIIAYSDCFELDRGSELKASEVYLYHEVVFFLPSWREIYVNDKDRLISFEDAEKFGENLKQIYTTLNYQVINVPLVSPEERCEFILENLHVDH